MKLCGCFICSVAQKETYSMLPFTVPVNFNWDNTLTVDGLFFWECLDSSSSPI